MTLISFCKDLVDSYDRLQNSSPTNLKPSECILTDRLEIQFAPSPIKASVFFRQSEELLVARAEQLAKLVKPVLVRLKAADPEEEGICSKIKVRQDSGVEIEGAYFDPFLEALPCVVNSHLNSDKDCRIIRFSFRVLLERTTNRDTQQKIVDIYKNLMIYHDQQLKMMAEQRAQVQASQEQFASACRYPDTNQLALKMELKRLERKKGADLVSAAGDFIRTKKAGLSHFRTPAPGETYLVAVTPHSIISKREEKIPFRSDEEHKEIPCGVYELDFEPEDLIPVDPLIRENTQKELSEYLKKAKELATPVQLKILEGLEEEIEGDIAAQEKAASEYNPIPTERSRIERMLSPSKFNQQQQALEKRLNPPI